MVIIGLVGSTCSGKTLFVEILKEKFNYQIIQLGQDQSSNIKLLDQALKNWQIPTIIYPITNQLELVKLSKRSYFHVIWLDSPIILRYKRYCLKYGETLNFEDFIKKEDQVNLYNIVRFTFIKSKIKIKFDNRLIDCIQKSKVRLNNGYTTREDFVNMIEAQRNKIDRPFRPSWEVYFMKVQISYVLKSRSNCMKKSVGAVLVDKYKRIISTSYIGTPKVMKNCNEGGCDVCNQDKSLNLILYKCWCIHAEEGCILEAGVALSRGSSLYTTLFPCVWCCKALVQAVNIQQQIKLHLYQGVESIYYDEKGDWDLSLQFLGDQIKIEQVQISKYIY